MTGRTMGRLASARDGGRMRATVARTAVARAIGLAVMLGAIVAEASGGWSGAGEDAGVDASGRRGGVGVAGAIAAGRGAAVVWAAVAVVAVVASMMGDIGVDDDARSTLIGGGGGERGVYGTGEAVGGETRRGRFASTTAILRMIAIGA